MPHPINRLVPFPFPEGRFPETLAAVVQTTVSGAGGTLPVLEVGHTLDNSWLVGDGVTDDEDAVTIMCLTHLVDADPSLAVLASLRCGEIAERDTIAPHGGSPSLIGPTRTRGVLPIMTF